MAMLGKLTVHYVNDIITHLRDHSTLDQVVLDHVLYSIPDPQFRC